MAANKSASRTRKLRARIAQPIPGAVPDANEIAEAFEPDDKDEKDKNPPQQEVSDADEKLLKQIRDDYRYCLDYWREVREEAAKDMRYVAGDPWEPDHRSEREDAHRPVMSPDEISQYLKQANNNLRQNKRAIKVTAKGQGATDKDAERRAAIIRGIEHDAGSQAAYTTCFEQCTSSSFGGLRITTRYTSQGGFEQVPQIKRIPNQFTILFDPDAKEADFSDSEITFVTDTLRKSKFARKYPKAQKKSFSTDDANLAPDWIQGENIVVAEYWKVDTKTRRKLQIQTAQGPIEVYDDELAKEDKPEILNEREVEEKTVTQYITNGVEILEKVKWIGSWIPILGCFGEEFYLNDGGQSKRKFFSLIRRMRDPQMMLAYIASQEAEEFGMAPRAPFLGYKGQFESDKEAWENLNKIPRAYVQIDPVVDQASGQLLPHPERPQFQPNIQAYEMAKESWRRAIQAAAGISPLPTSAQRQNEKSGVALDKIQTQEAIGSYHFTDNFDRLLENCGRQLNELITKTMDTPRHVGIRNPDDSHGLLRVMTEEQFTQAKLAGQIPDDADYLISDRGEFDVTISTGPSFQSERAEASDFVDHLIANLKSLPLPPQQLAALLAKAVKLKNIGPIGDDIAKIIDPQGDGEPIPPQAQAAIQKLSEQVKALNAACKHYEQQIQQLEFEKKAKVVEIEGRKSIEQMKMEIDLAKSEIGTKAQILSERMDIVADLFKQFHLSSHERGMQVEEHAHESKMADKNAVIAASQSAQDAAQQPEPQSGE